MTQLPARLSIVTLAARDSDPEGNRWEITWGPRATFDPRGALLSWN